MKLSYFALGVLLGIVWLALESVTAHAAKLESIEYGNNYNTRGYVGVWTDPDTGCRYIGSYVKGNYLVIGTPRLRADGKPDCPQVDKK